MYLGVDLFGIDIGVIATIGLAVLFPILWVVWMHTRRIDFIRSYQFPPGLWQSLTRTYPHLTPGECALASEALKHYFLAYLKSGCKYVSMPSQAVDLIWHDFILNTKAYDGFCKAAFGHFMHHTPAVVLSSNHKSNEGLRRCWWYACAEEELDPHQPQRLPLLFAVDTLLRIPDGFHYVPDCRGIARRSDQHGSSSNVIHCGGDFSDRSVDGTTDGFGDSSADGGGCGGGCGGGE